MDSFETLLFLLIGHAIADTILQPAWLSVAKRKEGVAVYGLALHGVIHAAFVFAVTGSLWLSLAEWVIHPAIDHAKARGWIGLKTDQGLHVLCKFLWSALA
ncbi:MAG: DUF3307 domain-containing protein [Beijerinckiaceae bacterium]